MSIRTNLEYQFKFELLLSSKHHWHLRVKHMCWSFAWLIGDKLKFNLCWNKPPGNEWVFNWLLTVTWDMRDLVRFTNLIESWIIEELSHATSESPCYDVGNESVVFSQSLHFEQDLTQSQFLNRVQLVWILSFSSPRRAV